VAHLVIEDVAVEGLVARIPEGDDAATGGCRGAEAGDAVLADDPAEAGAAAPFEDVGPAYDGAPPDEGA